MFIVSVNTMGMTLGFNLDEQKFCEVVLGLGLT